MEKVVTITPALILCYSGPAAYPSGPAAYPSGPAAYPSGPAAYPSGPAAYPSGQTAYPSGQTASALPGWPQPTAPSKFMLSNKIYTQLKP